MNRREFVRLTGGVLTALGASFGKGRRRRRAPDSAYLERGLTAMARPDDWFDAHWGASLIAGAYLVSDCGLEPELAASIQAQLEEAIAGHPARYPPFEAAGVQEDAVPSILRSLEPALFPRLVHELDIGRTDVLRWMVELRYEQFTSWPALVFVNRAASGDTPERWERIRREAESSPFGMTRCLFSPELDAALGVRDLGEAFRAPVESEVPTLFASATLDGKTPPERAERAREGFPDSAHVVFENGGHNDLIGLPQVHARVVRFLAGEPSEDGRVPLPALRFALLEGEDPLVRHPALGP